MSEHDEQKLFFDYVAIEAKTDPRWLTIYAIPNGAHLANGARSYKRLESEGLKKGVLDVNIDYPAGRYHGLRLELKIKPNKVTKEQIEWIDRHRGNGYAAFVCWSGEEAYNTVKAYFTLKRELGFVVQ